MLALTLVVWTTMYVRRTSFLLQARTDLRKIDTPAKMDTNVPAAVNLPAYAFKNLLELPVIFYVLCLYLYVTQNVDFVYLAAAWMFVLGRAVHSAIYCSYNKVMHRFAAYFLSALILWAMVLRATVGSIASVAT